MGFSGVLIDFDGVIAPETPRLTIEFVHGFINAITPVPAADIHRYVKSVLSFPPGQVIDLLFGAFGLEQHKAAFHAALMKHDQAPGQIQIMEDFGPFITLCEEQQIDYRILSLTSETRFSLLPESVRERVVGFEGFSKANAGHFERLGREMDVDLTQWAYIDDCPLALRSGKLSGLSTIMMLNSTFGEEDRLAYGEYIDHSVRSFTECHSLFSAPA
jgi:beta-phosphoglucomutase-like phosphatase (HAD superfamily)